jgi:hypothetical protein
MKINILTVGQRVKVLSGKHEGRLTGVVRRIRWMAGYAPDGSLYSHYAYDVRFPHSAPLRQGRYQSQRLEVC